MDNHTYNLVATLSEKGEAVSIYDTFLADSRACEECSALWKELKEADSKHIRKVKEILKSHIKEGKIT